MKFWISWKLGYQADMFAGRCLFADMFADRSRFLLLGYDQHRFRSNPVSTKTGFDPQMRGCRPQAVGPKCEARFPPELAETGFPEAVMARRCSFF